MGGQFLVTRALVTGRPPKIEELTLDEENPMQLIGQGPALIYFWAEWCGICRGMQQNVEIVMRDYAVLTVAERSGQNKDVLTYIAQSKLNWPVVNDVDGKLGQRYGVTAVPALFFINKKGDIVFTSTGYTSEWGLRFRLWLAGWL